MKNETTYLGQLFRKGLAGKEAGFGTEETLSCYRASIVYMFLQEMIRGSTALKCLELVPPRVYPRTGEYDTVWRIKAEKSVLNDLKINRVSRNTEGLDRYPVPDWIMEHESWLSEHVPNIAEKDGVIYYLSDIDHFHGMLNGILIENLESKAEEFRYGEGYRRLLGRSGRRIFLQKGGYKDRYYCYDPELKREYEYPYELLGLLDHCPVFRKNDQLYYEEAGVALALEPYNSDKEYVFYQNEMLVEPRCRVAGIMLPYFLNKTGEMRISEEVSRRVIWRYLQGIRCMRIRWDDRLKELLEDVPKAFTLGQVRDLYEQFAERITDDEGIPRVIEIMDILTSYIAPEQPADDILFLLCFCNDRMAKRNERFPCEALYERICRIGTENEGLHGITYDRSDCTFRNRLQDMLLYGLGKNEEEEKGASSNNGWDITKLRDRPIGVFYLKDGKLEVEMTPEEKTVMISTYKIPDKLDKRNGIVAYDVFSEKYYIRIPTGMSGQDPKVIVKEVSKKLGIFLCSMVETVIEAEADFLIF